MSERIRPGWLQWPETQRLAEVFARSSLRFVGGCVRDGLLGRPVSDVDAATPLAPEHTMDVLQKAGIKTIPTGLAHGTVTAVIGHKHFEITTLRKDVATDGRHATVAYTGDWEQDAARRDFTMNALYLSPQGELFDFTGGIEDARAGRVRFIGKATARIREDYLRILRFFRFHAHYGQGNPDQEALAACKELAGGMDVLSGERLHQELFKLLSAPEIAPTLSLMQETGVLSHVLGFSVEDARSFDTIRSIEKIVAVAMSPEALLAGFAFRSSDPHQAAKTMAERLRLSSREADLLAAVVSNHDALSTDLDDDRQKYLLRRLGREYFTAAVAMSWAAEGGEMSLNHPYAAMLQLAASWQIPVLPVTGADLLSLGMKEGKELGAALRQMEEAWEQSRYTLTRDALLSQLKKS